MGMSASWAASMMERVLSWRPHTPPVIMHPEIGLRNGTDSQPMPLSVVSLLA